MPEFVYIEADKISELAVPEPQSKNSYKFISKGTPAEIIDFWKREDVKDFRSKVRKVLDGLVSERGNITLTKEYMHGSKREKFEKFIKSKKWRTSGDRLISAAESFISF